MEDAPSKGRVVAIVGRPNVGKSALFNRLVGRRVAIVHAESGVTRDRLIREVEWEDERFDLIDTGGLGNVDSTRVDVIDAGIRDQVEEALTDAAVAVLVTDLQTGIVPLDQEVAGWLRGSGCTTFVVANKADTAERDADAVEHESLGLPVFPVSALHNRGVGDLMDAIVAALPKVPNVTAETPLKVAVVGRPNVGKSSYINRLLRNDRVIVSDVPGTTRDSIDVPFMVGRGEQARHYVLIDTAGLRRRNKVDNAVERFSQFRAEHSVRRADVVVLVLDAVQGPTAQDKKVGALVARHGKGCVVLVNKWDLAGETTQRQYGPAVAETLPFLAHCPITFASAETGYNIRRTIDVIDHVAAQVNATLPTGLLNRTLTSAVQRTHPPSYRGKDTKVFYATQCGVSPIRIRGFVTDPRAITPAYEKYLVKSVRRNFGLEGAPIFFQWRDRHADK